MRRTFLEPLGIADEQVVRLPTDGDLEASCARYDEVLDAEGGLDLAILGLGVNGHLGFNEPPSDPRARTRVVELTPDTVAANARYWGDIDDVPRSAVTIGMAQLLSARAIVLVVSGERKRAIVRRTLDGPVELRVPSSALRDAPGEITVVVDRAAWGDG